MGQPQTLVEVNEPIVGSRRCTGGLCAGGEGEFKSSAVEFGESFLGGGFGGPVELEEAGGPPNLGCDINDAAADATRPGPL